VTPEEAAARPWTWRLPDGTASNDWQRYHDRLTAVASRRGLQVQDLAPPGDLPLLLLTSPSRHPDAPCLLIGSGFHGEEAAGPWGVLTFLESVEKTLLEAVRLTLLPLVNVSGFREGRRYNDLGENPNRGYLEGPETSSREGRILQTHGERLRGAARDGLLACHEDVLLSHCYVYGMERREAPGEFSRGLLRVNASFFPVHPDGEVDGCAVTDGIVFNHDDTSFESWLLSEGTRLAACVETPGQQPIAQRIQAQAAMMRFFLEHASGHC
jgi:predicted deacylase